jgi:hypothetical protein
MKKQYLAILALLIIGKTLQGQNETDAFRYARYAPTGTARYSSLAGSMGAFGADFSVLSANNPAGIGLFKRTEFTFTPAIEYTKITSGYNGTSNMTTDYKLGLNNLGIVIAIPLPNSSNKWKTFQLATGYTNLARYNGYTVVNGANKNRETGELTGFLDYIAASVNGIGTNSIFISNDNTSQYSMNRNIASLAWYHWLMDTMPGTTNQYYNAAANEFNQQQTITTKGYLNEYVFSGGANYDDKLYFGITVGIPFFKYTQKSTYTESANPSFDTLKYYDEFQEKAAGVNLKFGLLYQPVKFMRFGVGFHTPTLYSEVKDSYYSSFNISSLAIDTINNGPVVPDFAGQYKYQLITPYHVIGNLVFLIDRYGFINVDYEYVDYTTSQMQDKEATYDFMTENNNIKRYYQGTHTVRIGGEVNLTPIAIRLGYAYTSNPYTKDIDKDGTMQFFSVGIGFKTRYFFTDFAYRYTMFKDKNVFYDANTVTPYSTDLRNSLFALTVGWKMGK